MSRLMIKPAKWLKGRLRSAWASTPDQSLRCPHEERLGPLLPIEHTAHMPLCWFCHEVAHIWTLSHKHMLLFILNSVSKWSRHDSPIFKFNCVAPYSGHCTFLRIWKAPIPQHVWIQLSVSRGIIQKLKDYILLWYNNILIRQLNDAIIDATSK